MTEETFVADTIDVVSVKFRNRGKMYFFDPAGLTLPAGETVIVETSKGLEIGDVVQANHTVPADRVTQPLRPVVRVATEGDKRSAEQGRKKEREAFIVCRQKIEALGLEMKLVDVECSFDGNKILFFFSSDGRVDFRDLVKELAAVFRTRIELRQIGVRDEARMLGGLGICGRPFCCGSFMDDFQPVSTKMAKTQSLSLNPAKISGSCGRLMCCLRYEQAAYEELVKNVPKNGAFVETPDGYGNVTQVNILRQTVKVKLDGPGDDSLRSYDADEVAAIPGGRPRDGSQPPHVLVLKPKKTKETESTSHWEMPTRLISSPADLESSESVEDTKKSGGNRRKGKENAASDGQSSSNRSRSGKKRSSKGSAPKSGAPTAQEAAAAPAAKPESGGEKASSGKSRSSRKRHKGPRPAKPQDGTTAPQNTAGEKQQQKPKQPTQNQPKSTAPAEGGTGENKPKKNRNRRRYRPRPKSGGEGGGSKPASAE